MILDLININATNCLKTDPNCHHNEIRLIDTCTYQLNLDPKYFIESLIKWFGLPPNQILKEKKKRKNFKILRKKENRFIYGIIECRLEWMIHEYKK